MKDEVAGKEWRRGQDSNLHILSDGDFQDLKVAFDLTLPLRIYQYNQGVQPSK